MSNSDTYRAGYLGRKRFAIDFINYALLLSPPPEKVAKISYDLIADSALNGYCNWQPVVLIKPKSPDPPSLPGVMSQNRSLIKKRPGKSTT